MSTSPCTTRLEALQPPPPAHPKVEELFDAIQHVIHSPEIVQDARRHGLDESDLDDAGSRCLLKLMENVERIEYDKGWRSYVRVSVKRFLIDQTRSKFRHPALALGSGGIDLAADEPSAFDLLSRREDCDRLARLLLAGADARSRRVVQMRLAGQTFEAIASKLKVGLTVVFRIWTKRVEAARAVLEKL